MNEQADSPRFHTKTDLRQMLSEAGAAPRSRFGQNFLIDQNLMLKLVETSDIKPTDCVLEVGTGTGCLTALLAKRAGHVVTVELDPAMARIAGDNLASFDNVSILHLDALKKKSSIHPDILAKLASLREDTQAELKLAANLPYDIATSLVLNLLLTDLPFARLCFTVQTEVADRFLACPGTSDYGPVSIVSQVLATGSRVCRLPASAFWPAPKVESSMLRLEVRPAGGYGIDSPPAFASFVRSFFLYRRKTLGRIAKMSDETAMIVNALDELGIPHQARPEALTVEEWVQLFKAASRESP